MVLLTGTVQAADTFVPEVLTVEERIARELRVAQVVLGWGDVTWPERHGVVRINERTIHVELALAAA